MSTTAKLRRGTAAQIAAFTPAEGELVYSTDTKKVFIGDAATVGGNPVSIKGSDGSPGASAYQLAVNAGYSGTQAQWIASLKGATGQSAYDAAVALGYSGSQAQWIADLKGAKGDQGPAGSGSRFAIYNSPAPFPQIVGTGSQANKPMGTVNVPGGTQKAQNGQLIITGTVICSNNANAKGIQIYWDNTLVVPTISMANGGEFFFEAIIKNTGTTGKTQSTKCRAIGPTFFNTSPTTTSTVDSTVDKSIGVYSDLTSASDTMQLMDLKVEVSN